MNFHNIEEIILELADLVIDYRELKAEVKELREYKEENRKRIDEEYKKTQVQTAELIKTMLGKEEEPEKEKEDV